MKAVSDFIESLGDLGAAVGAWVQDRLQPPEPVPVPVVDDKGRTPRRRPGHHDE